MQRRVCGAPFQTRENLRRWVDRFSVPIRMTDALFWPVIVIAARSSRPPERSSFMGKNLPTGYQIDATETRDILHDGP